MGVTKTAIFTREQNRMAALLKAIAHPARIAILQHLVNADSCICGELVNEFGLAQATISQHLKELKSVGIIKGTTEGVKICYCIDPVVWNDLKDQLSALLISDNNGSNCC